MKCFKTLAYTCALAGVLFTPSLSHADFDQFTTRTFDSTALSYHTYSIPLGPTELQCGEDPISGSTDRTLPGRGRHSDADQGTAETGAKEKCHGVLINHIRKNIAKQYKCEPWSPVLRFPCKLTVTFTGLADGTSVQYDTPRCDHGEEDATNTCKINCWADAGAGEADVSCDACP